MSLTRTTLAIEKDLLERFDAWMREHQYDNRSEALRDMIRSALTTRQGTDPDALVYATLTIVYDHSQREMAQELTRIQHADHHCVLCSQHVHLDHDNCLEVIVLKGPAGRLRALSDRIISNRGVKGGKLTVMTPDV